MKTHNQLLFMALTALCLSSCFVADPFTFGTNETRSFVGKRMVSTVDYELTYDFLGVDVATPRVSGRKPWNSQDEVEVVSNGTEFQVLSSAKRLLPSGQYWLVLCKSEANCRFYIDVRDLEKYARKSEAEQIVPPNGP